MATRDGSAPVLQLSRISRDFGGRVLLRDIDLCLFQGESVWLTGANGSGKTTLLKIASGILRPSAGLVSVCGYRMDRQPTFCKERLFFIADHNDAYLRITTGDYLRFVSSLFPGPEDEERPGLSELLNQLCLVDSLDKLIGELSNGQRKKLDLALAIWLAPPLVLIDETFEGLDASAREVCIEHFLRLRMAGSAFLFSGHEERYADRLVERNLRL